MMIVDNYAHAMINQVCEELPGIDPDLACLYALLALAKGNETSLEDVHDAWSIWTTAIRGRSDHKALVPFDELPVEIQELDRKYMNGIHYAAASRTHDRPNAAKQ